MTFVVLYIVCLFFFFAFFCIDFFAFMLLGIQIRTSIFIHSVVDLIYSAKQDIN